MEMILKSAFTFGDSVIIDGDKSLIARVVAITFRSEFAQIEVSWVHCGDLKSVWVDNWRLSPAEAA